MDSIARSHPDLAGDLVLTRELVVHGGEPRRPQRAARVGALTRVHRGAYIDASAWANATGEQRHRYLIAATIDAMRTVPVLCHESAAVLHGIPILGDLPNTVQVIAPAKHGGRSSAGVRRHGVTRMPDVVMVGGVAVTTPARTVVDLARSRPFASGLAAADHAIRARLVTRESLENELEVVPGQRGVRRARVVAARADGRAESVGESLSRAQMYLLGAPIPDLQHEFSDGAGFAGRVDFWWEDVAVIGEFDGRVKYGREGLVEGARADQVVWAEKRREDRLRRLCRGFVRWIWAEAMRPEALRRILAGAGVLRVR